MQYPLPPIFKTDTQRRLLVELLAGERHQFHTLTELAAAIDVDPTTVMREVDRLLAGGLIEERRVGGARTVAIDESNPFVPPLRQILDIARRERGPDAGHPSRRARSESGRHDRRPLPSARQRS